MFTQTQKYFLCNLFDLFSTIGSTIIVKGFSYNQCDSLFLCAWGFPLNWTICVTCYSAILKSINGKTTLDHTLAGTVTGLLYGFVMSPFELVKCQAQVNILLMNWQHFIEVRHESSPVVIQQMISEKGILSLRRGIGIAMFRDVSKNTFLIMICSIILILSRN